MQIMAFDGGSFCCIAQAERPVQLFARKAHLGTISLHKFHITSMNAGECTHIFIRFTVNGLRSSGSEFPGKYIELVFDGLTIDDVTALN